MRSYPINDTTLGGYNAGRTAPAGVGWRLPRQDAAAVWPLASRDARNRTFGSRPGRAERGTAALDERGNEAAIRVRTAIGSTRPNSDFRLEPSLPIRLLAKAIKRC
jgi:hypothetical protein